MHFWYESILIQSHYVYLYVLSLQPPTSPPVYICPEPVASHPVQETTTTTAGSEKALLV